MLPGAVHYLLLQTLALRSRAGGQSACTRQSVQNKFGLKYGTAVLNSPAVARVLLSAVLRLLTQGLLKATLPTCRLVAILLCNAADDAVRDVACMLTTSALQIKHDLALLPRACLKQTLCVSSMAKKKRAKCAISQHCMPDCILCVSVTLSCRYSRL